MIVTSIPAAEPLHTKLPLSAADYYAIANADLDRIESDICFVENAFLTIDYRLPYEYRYSIADSNGDWIESINQHQPIQLQTVQHHVDESVGFLEDRFSTFNICHFLFDKLARTTEFGKLQVDSYFMFANHDYYTQVFDLLDLKQTTLTDSAEKIITYRISKLYVSTSSIKFRHPGFNFRPEVVELLGRLRLNTIGKSNSAGLGKRLYVDRAATGARDVKNRNVLLHLLEEFEFTPVAFEDYSFVQQADIVNNSEILLGIHGAGLSNAMFYGSDNFRLLEIFPPLCATCDYWKLSNALNINYDAYIAQDVELPRPDYTGWIHNPKLNRRDIIIDENEFRQFLCNNT